MLDPEKDTNTCRMRSKPFLLHVLASRFSVIQQTISDSTPFFFIAQAKASTARDMWAYEGQGLDRTPPLSSCRAPPTPRV